MGIFCSQLGNYLFPAWELFVLSVVQHTVMPRIMGYRIQQDKNHNGKNEDRSPFLFMINSSQENAHDGYYWYKQGK
jgi:hypothetical protein